MTCCWQLDFSLAYELHTSTSTVLLHMDVRTYTLRALHDRMWGPTVLPPCRPEVEAFAKRGIALYFDACTSCHDLISCHKREHAWGSPPLAAASSWIVLDRGRPQLMPATPAVQGSCGYGLLDMNTWPYWSVAALSTSNHWFLSGPVQGCATRHSCTRCPMPVRRLLSAPSCTLRSL